MDLLKIDAEGAEVGILRGARRMLTGPDAPPVIVEANPVPLRTAGESVGSLRAELESLGYTVEVIEGMPWRVLHYSRCGRSTTSARAANRW